MVDEMSRKTSAKRLTKAERMWLIARSAAKLFARVGVDGTTTKELADAAGISEGLLFRYFPTKEDLTTAALEACRQNVIPLRIAEAIARPASTESLVRLTITLAEELEFVVRSPERDDRDTINRMLFRSLCEDGKFARMMLQDVEKRTVDYVTRCLEAAQAAGDLDADGEPAALLSWFIHQFAFGVMACQLMPRPSMFDAYDRSVQIKTMVRFRLRGAGLTPKALRRYLGRAGLE
jgi:AcrR family transcriptional regulator